MKIPIVLFLLIFNLTMFAQASGVVGTYSKTIDGQENRFEYNLTLNQDGTFTFHYFSHIKNGIPVETTKEGRGTWTESNKIITLSSAIATDIDEKYTLNFSNSKARFITKSARDKSDKIVATRIQFLQSDMPWMARIELFKI